MSVLPKREQVPAYHYVSEQSKALIDMLEGASLEAKAALEDVMAQFFVDTATWGLKYWEETLGIAVEEEKETEFRRSRIRSKLRGAGVTTVAMIQNVAESFSNGAVAVTEFPNRYRIEIKLVGSIGTPPNMDDLTEALREILPAHLAWDYVLVFNTWAMTRAHTWGELKGRTWGQVKGEKWQ
mgnify:CR=1 FL=1